MVSQELAMVDVVKAREGSINGEWEWALTDLTERLQESQSVQLALAGRELAEAQGAPVNAL